MSTMKYTFRFLQAGGPEKLRLENLPTPEPGLGEVQAPLEALSWNRAAFLWLANLCRESTRFLSNPLAALVVMALPFVYAKHATAQATAEAFTRRELVRPFRV